MARKYGLDTEVNISVPTEELIEKTGYDARILQQALVVPSLYGESYKLVVADPEIIEIKSFISLGIPVVLGWPEAIDSVWRRYFQRQEFDVETDDLYKAYHDYTRGLVSVRAASRAGEILLPL